MCTLGLLRARSAHKPSHGEIAERAYFIHLEVGEPDQLANWLRIAVIASDRDSGGSTRPHTVGHGPRQASLKRA